MRMAKFQQRKEESSLPGSEGEKPSPLRPSSGSLPTLSSLSGRGTGLNRSTDDQASSSDAPPADGIEQFDMMGGGIDSATELWLIAFLKSVYNEVFLIDFPSLSRVVKLTFVVMLTIVVASAFLYTVDGIFLRLSQILFETNVS